MVRGSNGSKQNGERLGGVVLENSQMILNDFSKIISNPKSEMSGFKTISDFRCLDKEIPEPSQSNSKI